MALQRCYEWLVMRTLLCVVFLSERGVERTRNKCAGGHDCNCLCHGWQLWIEFVGGESEFREQSCIAGIGIADAVS